MSWVRRIMGWEIDPSELDWEQAEVHEGREVGMIYRPTLCTYNLVVLAHAVGYEDREHVHTESEVDKRVLADLPALLEHAEEEIERRLPAGYSVRITEWNK